MKDLLLGVDLGTGGCKVVVIDGSGNVRAEASSEYATQHRFPGWAEQRPLAWIEAAVFCIRRVTCLVSASHIAAVATTAPTHNAVLLDAESNVIRDCIIWTDQRSASEAIKLEEECGAAIFAQAWQRPSPTWTLPQLIWLRGNEPESFARIRKILFQKDYLRFWLTGSAVTDRVDAQGSLLVDMRSNAWAPELVTLAGLDIGQLPPIEAPESIVGEISRAAAEATGLAAGTPVVAGTSDTAAECFGVGAVRAGFGTVKLATAGTVCLFDTAPQPNPRALTYGHVVPGLWYSCMATNSAAHSVRWYRDTFFASQSDSYHLIDVEAATVPPGAEGVLYHPYLMGERSPHWDPDLSASFVGLRASHTRKHFSRAVMEGVAFSLRDCLDAFPVASLPDQLRLIGGGAVSQIWPEILANVLALPIQRVVTSSAAFGAALLAGVGIGLFDGFASAADAAVQLNDRFEPDPLLAGRYAVLLDLYRDVQRRLGPVYRDLAKQRSAE